MATHRFRHGQMKLSKFPVASARVIERNDMLFFEASTLDVGPASQKDWNTNIATTQAEFADVFAGIAYEGSANLETDDISVDTSPDSVYEFAVASATYNMSQFLGPDQGTGEIMMNQQLEAAVTTSAVARPTEKATSAVTSLHVSFASVYNVSANTLAGVIG